VITYLDTSAAVKLLVDEAESAALTSYLLSPAEGGRRLVASWLLHTELYCAANRHPDDLDLDSVQLVLDTVSLIDLTRGDLLTAGALPGRLRSHDALHLAAALRVGSDEFLTYDTELADAAATAGLTVTRPA
jgi:predicted nucleic acid-binding protein